MGEVLQSQFAVCITPVFALGQDFHQMRHIARRAAKLGALNVVDSQCTIGFEAPEKLGDDLLAKGLVPGGANVGKSFLPPITKNGKRAQVPTMGCEMFEQLVIG